MKSHLKEYQFTIKTKAPVFIGSGQIMGKKEYIYDRYENRVYFLDQLRFFKGLMEYGLAEEYQQFMLDPAQRDLFGFPLIVKVVVSKS